MELSDPIEESCRVFFMLARERFYGQKLDTYNKLISLLARHAPNAANGSIELMFNEVQTLFASDQYLINKFENIVEYYRKNKNSLPHVETDAKNSLLPVEKDVPLAKNHQMIKKAVDLLNNVRRSLKGEQFGQFIDIVASFQSIEVEVEEVRKEAYKVLERHPLLVREWSGFLAEANIGKKSKAENYHELMFAFEQAMHKMDLLFHRTLYVKDSAKRLISENSDKDPMEIIDVGVYFSALDVRCVKMELKGCRRLLLDKIKLRGKAVRVAKRILCCAEKKIGKLMRSWSPEKNKMALKRHEEEKQIPVFDWYNDDEDVPKFDWL